MLARYRRAALALRQRRMKGWCTYATSDPKAVKGCRCRRTEAPELSTDEEPAGPIGGRERDPEC